MTRLAKNTAYLTLATIGQKLIAFVYFALIARIVGVEWTGKYFLALSVTTMVGVIADFGLTSVLVRESAKHPDEETRLLGNVLGAKLLFTLLAGVAAVVVTHAFGHDELTRRIVYLATGVMALDTIHLTLYGVFRGRHRLDVEAAGIVVGMVLTGVVGVFSLLWRPNLGWLVAALAMGSLWNVGYAMAHLWRVRVWPWQLRCEWRFIKRLLVASFPFALAAIFVKIYSTTDALLLKLFLGDAAVGIYSIAYKLTYAFQFFPLAFVAALYPTMSALIANRDRAGLHRVFMQAYWYVLLIAVPVVFGLWSVADELIVAVYGASYAASVLPFKTLIFVLLFIFLDFPLGALLNADDRQATKTAIMGGTMVLNVAANILLIPSFGVLGACYAALIAFVFLYGAGLVAARRSLAYDVREMVRVGAPIVLSGLVMALAVVVLKPLVGWVSAIPLGAIVYVAGLLTTKSLKVSQLRTVWKGMCV